VYGAPLTLYASEGKPSLVAGRTLDVVYLECMVHVTPPPDDDDDDDLTGIGSRGRTAGLTKASTQQAAKCVATDRAPFDLTAEPTGKWLAATFELRVASAQSALARAEAARASKGEAPPTADRVIVMGTTDDAPAKIDDGCRGHHWGHPCDPGPSRVIDGGHHRDLSLFVSREAVPRYLTSTAIAPLGELLGVRVVSVPTVWGTREELRDPGGKHDVAADHLRQVAAATDSDPDAGAIVALVRAELAAMLDNMGELRRALEVLDHVTPARDDVRKALAGTVPSLREVAAGKLSLRAPAGLSAFLAAP
jgi:hypothetical protein